MGLDMFLNAKRILWHNEDELASKVSELFPEIKDLRVKEVVVEAIYWRKCNQIHDWFVKNCQREVDDCGNYHVSREQLEELRQLILKVLAKKDASLLPRASGFFFGSDQIDAGYWEDLRVTEQQLTRVLDQFPEQWWFEYHSSW